MIGFSITNRLRNRDLPNLRELMGPNSVRMFEILGGEYALN